MIKYVGLSAGVAVATVTLWFAPGLVPVSAQSGRNGVVHVQKDCTAYDGSSGGHCTITVSNLAEIPATSTVYYDQAVGTPKGMLDSNIILDTGDGKSRAVGRCTLDLATGLGLCSFSDGTGLLAGFTARVDVSLISGNLWAWDGTYSFKPLPVR
jgi:hypothetical protein